MSQLPTMKVSLLNYVWKMNNYITLQKSKNRLAQVRPDEVILSVNSQNKRFIVNLEDETLDILNVMGPAFRNYYSVRETCEM
jgi:hypothetical protein